MDNIEPNIVPENPVVTHEKQRKNMKMFWLGLGGVVLLAIILVAAVGIYRVYAKASTDGFTVAVGKILRLPVLKIDGKVIRYDEFAEDMKAITIMRDYEKANGGQNAELTSEQMTDQVLWRLANNLLVEKGALAYNLKVEADDVDRLKTQLLQSFENVEQLNQELLKRYGWDLPTYERKVMRTFVLQSKLADALAADVDLQEGVKKQAQSVLEQIKNGADFVEMAKKYGQDGTKDNGGDLGFFAKGEMVPAFEEAAFALKVGEISPELVVTDYGYHIIKLEEKKTEKVKNEAGKTINQEQVRARHILFRTPAVDTYLDNLARTAEMHLYLKVHNPFSEILSQ